MCTSFFVTSTARLRQQKVLGHTIQARGGADAQGTLDFRLLCLRLSQLLAAEKMCSHCRVPYSHYQMGGFQDFELESGEDEQEARLELLCFHLSLGQGKMFWSMESEGGWREYPHPVG